MAIGQQSGVFQGFDVNEDVVANRVTTVSSGIWSSGGTTISSGSSTAGFFSSSAQSASSGDYYVDVHQEATSSSTSEVQFSIAYGHYAGSGSKNATDGTNASQAVYSQFKNIILAPTKAKFQYGAAGSETDSNNGYFIAVSRARMREKIDPGNWELRIGGMANGDALRLIDDSDATTNSSVSKGTTYFNIVTGSISGGTAEYKLDGTSKQYYGRFYPYLGVYYLDASKLDLNSGATQKGVSIATAGSTNADDANSLKLFNKLNTTGGYFQSRREEDIKSTHYFCRVKNSRYNFSQNPTYYTGSGELTNPNFTTDPRTYITTVGLYNANSELLAVAKLSKPFLKTPAREAVIKVRLDF
jgi:hypothetical protein|tara:strand:+ start:11953 stop:13023 length:1071 start_codon:yes stop_codon:yes gene_type:complete